MTTAQSPLASKLASLPWQAVAVALFALPTGGVLLTSHFAGGKGPSMHGGMPDMPVAAPPGSPGAAPVASSEGFDILSLDDWSKLRDRVGALSIANSPIGSGTTRAVNQRGTNPQATPQARGTQAQPVQQDPEFPSSVQLTSVMRLASRGVVTPEAANLNARAVLGGKLRKVGQEAAPGWTITAINVDAGTVSVQNAKGSLHTITLRKPASESGSQSSVPSSRGTPDLPGPMVAPDASVAPPSLAPESGPEQQTPGGL